MSTQYQIYGIGNALMDMEFIVDDKFLVDHGLDKGVMTLTSATQQQSLLHTLSQYSCKQACGGSAANTVMAAQHFGSHCFYSCKVADDATGDIYWKNLTSAGIATNLKQSRPSGTTGKCLVLVTPDAERTMLTYLGISETVSVNELAHEAINKSAFLYIEGYLSSSSSGAHAAIQAREHAQAQPTQVALTLSDPNIVQYFKPQLTEIIGPGVDLLFCNEKEAQLWADSTLLEDVITALKSTAKRFVITRGSQDTIIFDGQRVHEISVAPIKPIDTNGAGDMFAGAFLYAITHGYNEPKAGRFANFAAAAVITQYGPRLNADRHAQLLQQFSQENS